MLLKNCYSIVGRGKNFGEQIPTHVSSPLADDLHQLSSNFRALHTVTQDTFQYIFHFS